MYVDNINVVDDVADNLAVTSISVAENLKAGRIADVKVGVKNLGSNSANGYTVSLYQDDEKVMEKTIDDPLASLTETSVDMSYAIAPDIEGVAEIYAKLSYDADSDESDNTTEKKTVYVTPVRTAVVNDLAAESASDGIMLTWSKPSEVPVETVTESFEDYLPWSTSFGDWSLYNGNPNAEACNFFDGYTTPFYKKKIAYIVFEPETLIDGVDVLSSNPGFAAHSGKQYAAVPYEWQDKIGNDEGGFVDGDNWLISPLLSGNEQTISFFVNNVQDDSGTYSETFDVLLSKSNKNINNFVKVGATRSADGKNPVTEDVNWKQFSVSVPKGTKYFAIHQNTPAASAFLFGIDDVTFEVGAECGNDEIIGYCIYRNGKKIDTVDGTVFSYTDKKSKDISYYNVTIVFKDANGNITESSFSNTATITSSVEVIENLVKASSYDVYSLDGKEIITGAKNLQNLPNGSYIINGRKYVIR